MSQLQATARLRIHDGKLDAFKEAAARCRDVTRAKDTSTLQYDWFIDDAGTECVVRDGGREAADPRAAGVVGEPPPVRSASWRKRA